MPPKSVIVVAGTNLLSGGSGELYKSKTTIYHSEFNMFALYHDIGLIRVNQDIQFNEKVQPIKLPTTDFDETIDNNVTLTGWGKTWVSFAIIALLEAKTETIFFVLGAG